MRARAASRRHCSTAPRLVRGLEAEELSFRRPEIAGRDNSSWRGSTSAVAARHSDEEAVPKGASPVKGHQPLAEREHSPSPSAPHLGQRRATRRGIA